MGLYKFIHLIENLMGFPVLLVYCLKNFLSTYQPIMELYKKMEKSL